MLAIESSVARSSSRAQQAPIAQPGVRGHAERRAQDAGEVVLAEADLRREVLDPQRLVQVLVDAFDQRPLLRRVELAIEAQPFDVEVVPQQMQRDALADGARAVPRAEQVGG